MKKWLKYEDDYISLLKEIIKNGYNHDDRTGVGRKSIQGHQLKIDMKEGFPLLSSKAVSFHNIKLELFWFLGYHLNIEPYNELSMTNIKFLVDNNVNIWNEWPHQQYVKETSDNITLKQFKELIKNDYNFANNWGNLGDIYGKQWNDWNGINQIDNVIESITNNPFSSRHIISAWNVSEIQNMLLPPCHNMFQFLVNDKNELSLIFNMRSTDVFLGLPYNIASYGLLLHIIAKECNLGVNQLIYNGADVHIYQNHLEAIEKQIDNYENKFVDSIPILALNYNENFYNIDLKDVKIVNYENLGIVKAPVAI